MLFNTNSKLCDIIFYDSSIISVINRFGINLGVGDYSISEICQKHNIDESFLISIINTFLNGFMLVLTGFVKMVKTHLFMRKIKK